MGVTDIDDKIIRRAREENVHPACIAQKFERRFFESMSALQVLYYLSLVTRLRDRGIKSHEMNCLSKDDHLISLYLFHHGFGILVFVVFVFMIVLAWKFDRSARLL